MPQDHPYCRLQLPRDAPFELRPSSPGKGWGGFATRLIKRGDQILTEKPLFVIPKSSEYIIDNDIWATIARLTPVGKYQFSLLRDNANEPFKRINEAFAENSFSLSVCSGHGLFLLHSRFNHSCIPNAKVPDPTGEVIAFVGQDASVMKPCVSPAIAKPVCSALPFNDSATRDEKFMRGLQYLTLGVDIDGKRQNSSSPIIADPKLKQAAEDLSVPLSNRLIYLLLTLYLFDEEGLLDHLQRERLEPSIVTITSLFQTETNAKIVKIAMAQKTWLGKVLVAFRLYGRYDAADESLPELLRMLRNSKGG
ncbi:SET domain-containing protein [Daldinia caldariorum]|uniref:SET domain-containing protein n=1 Tax=Daldinia caldariorum TaxID=326644 RepID=UPI00200771A5|nr:SET domain-containing protein [Daldinia caldariorum]KAI1468560.1 SET domain-containing protein [Daldinia caldariorum]